MTQIQRIYTDFFNICVDTGIIVLVATLFCCVNIQQTFASESNYYSADLTQFPPKVREWIMNTAYPKDVME